MRKKKKNLTYWLTWPRCGPSGGAAAAFPQGMIVFQYWTSLVFFSNVFLPAIALCAILRPLEAILLLVYQELHVLAKRGSDHYLIMVLFIILLINVNQLLFCNFL